LVKRSRRFVKVRSRLGHKHRIGRFFLTGARPAAEYGAAVTGICPTELLAMRRHFAKAHSPFAQGTSLSHKLALRGDDAWRAALAPAIAWAQETWRAVTGDSSPHFSIKELAVMWHGIGRPTSLEWSASRGPVAAMHLSLRYIDWEMKEPFVLSTDRGDRIVLTANSPGMVAKLMRDAMQRKHERMLVSHYFDASTTVQRMCIDLVKIATSSHSRKFTPLEQGCLSAWFCDAI